MNTTTETPKAAPAPMLTLMGDNDHVTATVTWQGERVNVRIALDLSGQTGLIPGVRPRGYEMPSMRVQGTLSVEVYPVRNVYLDAPHTGEGMSLFGSATPTPAGMERLLTQIGIPQIGIPPITTLDGVRAVLREKRMALIAACPGHARAGRTETTFRGPAPGARENPMAHGGSRVTERCACGAVRVTNVNGIYVEVGAWGAWS